jgi:hypothetical protein
MSDLLSEPVNWKTPLRLKAFLTSVLVLGTGSSLSAAETQEESLVKFAFYSSAWGENTDDGLRLVAFNQTANPIRIDSITFLKGTEETEDITIDAALQVPAGRYADSEYEYIDILGGDECIERTMLENWKLVEVSNYTLNPSVRNLIIENTNSFRIYQCVENVSTQWTDLSTGLESTKQEWVLFHFESRAEY